MKLGDLSLRLTDVDKALLKAAADAGLQLAYITRGMDDDGDTVNAEVLAVGFNIIDLISVTHRYVQDDKDGKWVEFEV